MEAIFYFLRDHFPVLFSYKYFFVFAGAAIEGFNVQVLAGFLIGIDGLKLLPTFLLTVAGQFINGFLWYGIGYFAGSKPLDYWVRHHRKGRILLDQIKKYFVRHSGKALVLTRITVSFTAVTLIIAGTLKYNLKKFSLYNLIGGTGWTIITLGFGYFFGESFKYVFQYVGSVTMVFLGIIVCCFAIYYIFRFFNKIVSAALEFNKIVRDLGDKMMTGIDNMLSADDE